MTQRTPAVTIGMPVFNGDAVIRDALDALLQQDFTDFALVISDNASTDCTQSICEEYARRDSRIRYVRQRENIGAVANFKYLLEQAESELFMWAAHDDLWGQNYLANATNLLVDTSINFVFPSFELRSIRLQMARKINPEIFRFIESSERKWRVLHFIALHFRSHSANIVYSLFRTAFLRAAWAKQDISNDGLLAAVVLSLGRGAIGGVMFSKRYRTIWPGMLPQNFSRVCDWIGQRDSAKKTQRAINEARTRMLSIFPEYRREIVFIYDRYRPSAHDKNYRVCSIRELF